MSRSTGTFDEVRIAQKARAIEIGAPHGLGHQVMRFDRAARLLLDLERLEHVEHLDERHAAGARRRHRDDLEVEELAADRRAFLRLIRRQVGLA